MIEELTRIAREAGDIILKYYAKDAEVRWKKDNSPVTSADIAAHDFIVGALKRFGFPVISEESEEPREAPGEKFFLVDPVDGTREFIKRTGEFVVCIALVEGGRPVAGVVHAPVFGETYGASAGDGAFLIKGDSRQRLPLQAATERVLVRSRHHDTEMVNKFAVANGITKNVVIGSALKFGRLAAGQAMIYPRFGRTWEWDVAAGQAVLMEAGGKVLDLTTRKEPIYAKPGLQNNWFIASAPGIELTEFVF